MVYRYRIMSTTVSGKPTKSDLKAQIAWYERELRETLDHAKTLQEYIAVARKMIGKKAPEYEQQDLPGVAVIPRRRTKGAVLAKQVEEVLRAADHPLHVREIVKKLAENGNPVIAQNPANTTAVLLIRRADQFKKVSPNTFDLVNKTHKAEETA
jgi:hypothetical protein